ncbi:hypothetical protein [Paenibacillus chitinolyticus]|uniref:hypothetical protein n=1 Tax=Paenibacillus chitinolyticus TaxID=79263 RepID=UPI003CFBE827
MHALRQAAMVKSVAKNMRAKQRKESSVEKIKDNLYAVLRKVGKPLDEVTKSELTEKDYKVVLEYFEIARGCSSFVALQLYPKLK